MLSLAYGLAAALDVFVGLFKKPSPQPWYAFGKYMGDFHCNPEIDPYFFDPSHYPWVKTIEENWKIIREELDAYLAEKKTLDPYFNPDLISSPACWRVIGLKFWGVDHSGNQRHFKKTMELFNQIPGIMSVSFSQLQPKSTINPHNGDTNAQMRCHLGMKIPASLPTAGFTVGTESKSWEEGKLFLFCDAQRHYAVNNSNETRLICLFDVIRPEFERQQNSVCATVLAALLMQKVMQLLPFIRYRHWIRRPLYRFMQLVAHIPVSLHIGSSLVFKFLS